MFSPELVFSVDLVDLPNERSEPQEVCPQPVEYCSNSGDKLESVSYCLNTLCGILISLDFSKVSFGIV